MYRKKVVLRHYKPRKIKIQAERIGFLFNKFPSLTHLSLSGGGFRHSISVLPLSLTHLSLSCEFNQPVDNPPSSLTHLTFGDHFDEYVDHLPSSLTHLTFGYGFINRVDHLPSSHSPHYWKIVWRLCGSSLMFLKFGFHFNHLWLIFLLLFMASFLIQILTSL